MSMSSDTTNVEVLIIGGARWTSFPPSNSAAPELRRLARATARLSVHAKAAGIQARTMEIYRQLGLANVVRKNSADWNGIFTVGWMTRLKGQSTW